MFTNVSPSNSAKAVEVEALNAVLPAAADVRPSIVVSEIFQKVPSRKAVKARPKERRGEVWNQKWLEWSEVKQIHNIAFQLRRAGLPFNRFLTIMPPVGLTQREAKRVIAAALKALTQELTRAGAFNLSLTVYEKERGGRLHAHIALHVPHGLGDKVKRWTQNIGRGEDRDAIPFRPYHVGYMTKQRRFLPPDCPRTLNGKPHQWQPADRIIGPRWSISKDLQLILEDSHAA